MSQAYDSGRRAFLARAAAGAGAALTAGTLELLPAHAAWAAQGAASRAAGYGALRVVNDGRGRPVLALPAGFELVTFGVLGDPLLGGGGSHARNADGMGAFPGPGGTVRLIRNHELRNAPNDFTHGITGEARTRYDRLAMGGTITIDYDARTRRVVREFVSSTGTIVNRSGGLAYRDAGWLTCEESVGGPRQGWERRHGYTFFVPAARERAEPARPLRAMGRFVKEAAVADSRTGIVYQTEDAGSAGFYRFLPRDPADLARGGTLQMLKVTGHAQYDAREGQAVGMERRAVWVTIPDPDPDLEAGAQSCFAQGYARGGARFHRLEGVFRGDDGAMLFVSTTGGDAKSGEPAREGFRPGYGQLWRYAPLGEERGVLTLVYESARGALLDSPDNLCVTPRGGILICEDDATRDGDRHPLAPELSEVNRLVGLARGGEPFTFAVNLLNASEFAGACFSPDGRTLFVNLFGDGTPGSGLTCAISGPWHEGPL